MRAIVFNARIKVGIHIYLLCLSGLQHFRWHVQKEEQNGHGESFIIRSNSQNIYTNIEAIDGSLLLELIFRKRERGRRRESEQQQA